MSSLSCGLYSCDCLVVQFLEDHAAVHHSGRTFQSFSENSHLIAMKKFDGSIFTCFILCNLLRCAGEVVCSAICVCYFVWCQGCMKQFHETFRIDWQRDQEYDVKFWAP